MAGSDRPGRLHSFRFSIAEVMGAVLFAAAILTVQLPLTGPSGLPGSPWTVQWSHFLMWASYRAERLALVGAMAGLVVIGRGLRGGAPPSRVEWLAVALAVFAGVEANARAGDAAGRAMVRVTGGWVEMAGVILPAFSSATVGMVVTLTCLIALQRAEGRGRSHLRAPLVAVLFAAVLWGPLPAVADWARWTVGDWTARFHLDRLAVGQLYALAVVSAIRDFARPRPARPGHRITEWAAMLSWLLLALAWTCQAISVILPNPSRARTSTLMAPHPILTKLLDLAGPELFELTAWLVAMALSLLILRLVDQRSALERPSGVLPSTYPQHG
ncbi:hypothetical protein AB1L88_02770 [Tautonia sp. JC769]|uniref:hypothetical protein n=1 Tax=Tautonia sp. JC769 TaxID=3232135 RepID=UPI00345838DF